MMAIGNGKSNVSHKRERMYSPSVPKHTSLSFTSHAKRVCFSTTLTVCGTRVYYIGGVRVARVVYATTMNAMYMRGDKYIIN